MRIHHLDCGTLHPLGGALIGFPHAVCHCLLLETEDGLVLVDTGIGLADTTAATTRLGRGFVRLMRPRLDQAETAVRRVTALGFRRADVRHIVLTHLDPDHAGGIADFPAATVHVTEPEYLVATGPPTRADQFRYRSPQWSHGPRWRVHPAGDGTDWFGFPGAQEFPAVPGVFLVPLPGHSRGHTGIAIRRDRDDSRDGHERWLLHAGDAYFHHSSLEPGGRTPVGATLFEAAIRTDTRAWRATRERLSALRAEPRLDIISAHDVAEYERWHRQPGG
jgi:glyoxylase-like metal-dependent hydrolase (beta-lactamase superfamily II)